MTALTALLPATPYALPLRASFRLLRRREGVLLHGPAGAGEFAPFADYTVAADARWLASAVDAAVLGVPAAGGRTRVPVNAILPTVPVPQLAAAAVAAVEVSGCTTIKLKVGEGDERDDLARVAAVRAVLDERLGAGFGRLRLDANGRWDVDRAIATMAALGDAGVEYVEQPCSTVAELVRLRRAGLPVPVAVDETIRRDRQTDVTEFADVAVLKVGPLGGPAAVGSVAAELGVPVVISGPMESSIGVARDTAVAAALAQPGLACGLATGLLLADDLVAEPVLPVGGELPVTAALSPDPLALRRARDRVSEADAAAWLRRAEAAWQHALAEDLIPPAALAALGVSA